AAHIEDLTQQLAVLHARLDVLEARQVPYSPEELALFRTPPNTLVAAAHATAHKSSHKSNVDGATIMAEAQRYVVARDFEKAEGKYLELLKDDEKYVHQALAVDASDAYSLSVLGRLKFQQKKYDEALDSLSRAAQIDPQNPEVQNYLGITLSDKGLRGPAETALRKAIEIDPNYASAHNNLAVVYATQNPPLLELARWHYQKALA